MARWWRQERSPWATASWPPHQRLAIDSRAGAGQALARMGHRRAPASGLGLSPAQQEYRLLAEQVPEPPRRVQTQRPPPGVERHCLLHLGSGHVAELAEILDGAEM